MTADALYLIGAWPEFFQVSYHAADNLSESCTFGCRDPFEPEPFRFKTKILKHQLYCLSPCFRLYITFQVMAVSDMSAADENPIGAFCERVNDKIGVNHS